jgi:PadR family transcriptional regulator PadR
MAKSTVEAQNLTRSCNEALILASLATGPKHGYQLAVDIEQRGEGLFRFNHGTLYPILHKLEKDGLIRGTWSDDGNKRKRKSYALTDRGRKYAREQVVSWKEFYDRFFALLGATSK